LGTVVANDPPPSSFGNRISTALYTRPSLMTLLLFALPLGFMLIVYVGSLVAMLVNSFYHLNDITGKVVREFTLCSSPPSHFTNPSSPIYRPPP
jgi:putative spermidine/putrescine transport system permease protein